MWLLVGVHGLSKDKCIAIGIDDKTATKSLILTKNYKLSQVKVLAALDLFSTK